MHFITGPLRSGKTTLILKALSQHLASRRPTLLLVPTSTMAEHLRNRLARQGVPVRPGTITTFSKFLEPFTKEAPAPPDGAIEYLLTDLLNQGGTEPEWAEVRDYPGFRSAVAAAVEEATAAGLSAQTLGSFGKIPELASFCKIHAALEAACAARGWKLRGDRLRFAAAQIRAYQFPPDQQILVDGFFSFTPGELDILEALAANATVTGTLPGEASEESLRRMPAEPRRTKVAAVNMDQEVVDVARRILIEHRSGRPFRDIGIVLRTEEPYVPALRTTLERFGIPARFYFGTPLHRHSVIRFLVALAEAMQAGWPLDQTAEALKMEGAPLSLDDRFDLEIRSAGLAKGLGALPAPVATKLANIESWRHASAVPDQWNKSFASMTSLYQLPDPASPASHEQALHWAGHAAALRAFQESAIQAASLLDPDRPVTCQVYWQALKTVLAATTLRVPDHRRDVVHVMDAYEARQWNLPVVFLCGALDEHYPRHQAENPVLSQAVRQALRDRGIQLPTQAERRTNEEFLFEIAATRATEHLICTYPSLNAKGNLNQPSFLLNRLTWDESQPQDLVPRPSRDPGPEPVATIHDPAMLDLLRTRHATLSASSIESFQQCPYQFFATKSLKLKEPPQAHWERLDIRLQGIIVHDVLSRLRCEDRPLEAVFSDVFEDRCRQARVPDGYRTEAIRLELLYNLELIASDEALSRGADFRVESDFILPLDDDTIIKGRIDLVEFDAKGNALVVDYKYKSPNGIDRMRLGHADQTYVQGGLYLLALAAENKSLAGMVYCGMKTRVRFGGWVVAPHHAALQQACQPEELQDMMREARRVTLEAAMRIRQGEIAPKPKDETRCDYCAVASACRVEVAERRTLTAGAESWL